MNFENYTDHHKNSYFVENGSILFIEVKNQDNLKLNDICCKESFFENTKENNDIHQFEDFLVVEVETEDRFKKEYTLIIKEHQITLFKIVGVSKIDELSKTIIEYKKELGNLDKEAKNLEKQHLSKIKKKSNSQNKTKQQSKNKGIKPPSI